MSKTIIQRIVRQFLPFAVPSENRAEPFTSDLEEATVFSLAELEREKGGGLLMKQPEETVVFVAKMGYPFWLFPWSEVNLIFDGLKQTSFSLNYVSIPEVNSLQESLASAVKTRDTYLAFLSDTTNHLETSTQEKSFQVNGLVTEPQFLAEFDSYRHEATKTMEENPTLGLLTPTLDEAALLIAVRELDNLHMSLQASVENLYECVKLVDKTTRQYVKELHDKARNVKEDFAIEIKEEEKNVAPRISHIKEDYDFQINSMAKSYEKQYLPIQQEKARLENSKERALARIEQYKLEAKAHADKGHSATEQKWNEKADKTRKEISAIENQVKQAEKSLKDLEEKRSLETFKIKEEMETKITETRENLRDLEAARDAKVQICDQDIQKLEELTKMKNDQLSLTSRLLESNMTQFGTLGIKKNSGPEECILYYVPFYVICFQSESKKRYITLPPSVVSTVGVFTVLKGALGMAKIRSLLVPRFKTITAFMDSIQALTEQNAVFEAEIDELGAKNNMLASVEVRENIKKGLEFLKNEGWLSDKEAAAVAQRVG